MDGLPAKLQWSSDNSIGFVTHPGSDTYDKVLIKGQADKKLDSPFKDQMQRFFICWSKLLHVCL